MTKRLLPYAKIFVYGGRYTNFFSAPTTEGGRIADRPGVADGLCQTLGRTARSQDGRARQGRPGTTGAAITTRGRGESGHLRRGFVAPVEGRGRGRAIFRKAWTRRAPRETQNGDDRTDRRAMKQNLAGRCCAKPTVRCGPPGSRCTIKAFMSAPKGDSSRDAQHKTPL